MSVFSFFFLNSHLRTTRSFRHTGFSTLSKYAKTVFCYYEEDSVALNIQ